MTSGADVRDWIALTGQDVDASGSITATFIVDTDWYLWIADRRSEHVACARGGPVFSAGELTFSVSRNGVEATHVSNQSTGYCPRPDSWEHVALTLEKAGISYPGSFGLECKFRLCKCGQVNIVKDAELSCDACGSRLPDEWNFYS